MTKPILLGILLSLTLISCSKDCIEESGTVITDYVNVSGFTGISTDGNFDIVIDTGFYEVSVKADRAFVPYVKLDKTGDILNIYVINNRCLNGKRPYIHIYAPDIESITQSGSGTIDCYNLYNTELTIENEASGKINVYNLDTYNAYVYQSGSGSIYLNGIGNFISCNLSSSGVIDGLDFEVDKANVSLSGSGKIYVNAYSKLDVIISGSGVVYYHDHPYLKLTYDIPGSGDVIPY